MGVQQGSALAAALPELDEMLKKTGGRLGDVKQYASYPEAYQDLVNGRTDYVINTVVTVASLVREKPDVFEMGKPVSSRLTMLGQSRRATRSCSNSSIASSQSSVRTDP